jgi:hypothetical protein
MARPPGNCQVCKHPERARIELTLAGGASRRAIGQKFKLHHLALRRHWILHVSEERKAALTLGPVQAQALAARVAEESESVIDHHRTVRAGLYQLYDSAIEASDRTGGAMLAGRLTEVNSAIARITGQLATSPLVQNTFNTVNFAAHPAYLKLRDGLVALSRAHPEVRPDLFAMLKRLDAEPDDAPPSAAAHAIEHEGARDG